jgi:hypothetical protein
MFGFKIYNCRTGQASFVGAGFVRMWPASRNRRGEHDLGSFAMCIIALALFLFTNTAFAHEQWILTPEQIIEFNSKPKPDLYTHWSANNITLITVFCFLWSGGYASIIPARVSCSPICKRGLLPMEIMFR